MKRFRLAAIILASFAAGIAFVIACGNGACPADAASPDARTSCSSCEPPITAGRIYRKRNTLVTVDSSSRQGVDCDAGDTVIGGGCWIYSQNSAETTGTPADDAGKTHPLIVSAPFRYTDTSANQTGTLERWACSYDNRAGTVGLVIEANVICFKPAL